MDEQTETEDKKLTAKKISKAFKFIAPAGAIICAVLLWVGVFKNATIGEICALWATVYGLGAGTIDANIIIDKYTGGKN
jgi:putative copper export protein